MKKVQKLLIAVMAIAMCACSTGTSESLKVTPTSSSTSEGVSGAYTGSAKGMNGNVDVTVTLKDGSIETITVDSQNETVGFGDVAVNKLPTRIVESQTVNVDNISGATITSAAIKTAVKQALTNANALDNFSSAKKEVDRTAKEDETVGVVIVGAGLTGINAAYELKNNYPDVSYILLEQTDVTTGSLPPSGGAIIATNSKIHDKLGKQSEISDIIEELEAASGHEVNHTLVENVYSNSERILNFLIDNGFDTETTVQSSGANDKVTALLANDNGEGFALFYEKLLANNSLNLRMHSKATSLLVENGKVTGVAVEDETSTYNIHADAVILATGGFGYNKQLMAKYAPEYKDYYSRTSAGADGSGFTLTEQFNPTIIGEGVMGPSVAAGISMERLNAKLVVNENGERFANEENNTEIAATMTSNGYKAFEIVDSDYVDVTGSLWPWVESLEEHINKGYAKKYDTLEELANDMGIDVENLKATIDAYNEAIDKGKELEFGLAAEKAEKIDHAPYYVETLIPFYFGTIPSLKVDNEMHLLDGDGNVVEGIYCAGELTEANIWDTNYPGAGVGISYATYSGPYAAICAMNDLKK